jgi:hypothetical protein
MALALGETIELQNDADVIRRQQRLDAAGTDRTGGLRSGRARACGTSHTAIDYVGFSRFLPRDPLGCGDEISSARTMSEAWLNDSGASAPPRT